MSKTFRFLLSTPDAVLYDGEVESVILPTPNGEIGIMADHEPLVSLISPGMMTIKDKSQEKILATGSGFIKVNTAGTKSDGVSPVQVEAFTQTAEFADSIDEQRALEAKKQAELVMAEKADEISLANASSLLERNIARLKTIERHKKRSHH